MKYMLSIFALIFGFSWMGCGTTAQHFTPETFEGDMISFGNRGGFAGAETKYTILSNGQVFKNSRFDEDREIERLDKKVVKQLFENIDNLNLKKEEINDPGNLTAFLNHMDGKQTTKWLWGGENVRPSEQLKVYYKTLWRLMKEKEKAVK